MPGGDSYNELEVLKVPTEIWRSVIDTFFEVLLPLAPNVVAEGHAGDPRVHLAHVADEGVNTRLALTQAEVADGGGAEEVVAHAATSTNTSEL
jgi:hypothetical protein